MRLIPILLAVLFSTSVAQHDLLHAIVQKDGLDALPEQNELHFTFTVHKDTFELSRSYTWDLQTDSVWLGDSSVGHNASFVNDIYWLLFPWMVHKDRSQVTISEDTISLTPLGLNAAHALTVDYISDQGFTPGDRYVLYVSADTTIVEWAFHKGGSDTITRSTTWQDYRQYGPLRLSTLRKSPDGFYIEFSGLALQ